MRRKHISAAVTSAAVLLAASVTGNTWTSSASPEGTTTNQEETSYVVLANQGASAQQIADQLAAGGAKVTSVNAEVGLITATSQDSGFRTSAAQVAGVSGVAAERTIGYAPTREVNQVEQENLVQAGKAAKASQGKHRGPRQPGADPLDSQLWGMKMIQADKAHAVTLGSKRVKVGIIDTGVQADHPDIHANFDYRLSRNFVTDIPEIDGPCESASCVDPASEDDGGHGTHVAGTIGAALNGLGVSGVAPKVDLVNIRAGQDSGYFFVGPTVDALTYAGKAGIDVVNMSFYVDPWLYNCLGGAPEDSPAQAAEQGVIIEAMNRALNYAHRKNVTLVAATGNNHEDLSKPRVDVSSPDYGTDPYDRTIDNATCLDLPVEGPHVIGVNAIGPSGTKSDFSNYTTDLASGEVEVSAPGGWFRDGFGTASYKTNGNLILSTVPLISVQETGEVDEAGNVTELGESTGVQKICQPNPASGTSACGYYAFYQGTSMASPHAAGVAALAVAAHGRYQRGGEFGLEPNVVRALLLGRATDRACPPGGVRSYIQEGRTAEWDATCVGSARYNGFYGHGVVNALRVVR